MFQRIIASIGLMIGLFLIGLVAGASAQADKCNDPGPFPKADEFVAVNKAPELFSETKPVYPAEEKGKGVEGLVWVKALVDKCGKVKEAVVAKSSGVPAFDDAALTAARQNEFIPAESESGPVACWVTYKVEFRLSEDGVTTKVKPEPKVRDWKSEGYPSPDEFVPVEIMPEMVYQEKAAYPAEAMSKGLTGLVWVKVLVTKEGAVEEATVGKSSGTAEMDKAAVEAAYKCKFKPGIQNGQPVACWVTYKVEFRLDSK